MYPYYPFVIPYYQNPIAYIILPISNARLTIPYYQSIHNPVPIIRTFFFSNYTRGALLATPALFVH